MRTHCAGLLGLALLACTSSPDGSLDAAPGADAAADAGTPDAAPAPDAAEPDAGIACTTPAVTARGEVATRYATLRGVARGATFAYLGVPYAAPPVGALRFAPPAPPACETAIREASAFGAICPQLDRQDNFTGDEDCLTLNVWSPLPVQGAPLPVLVFIHGGGNNQGASSVLAGQRAVYDGEALAARGNVVVTINYRLGALGWATHAALDAERASPSGNYGLRDQIAALEWVRDNIAAFGGNPARVLIFGESAGGVNVCSLYTSPLARGLFSAALIESGGCVAQPKASGLDATMRLLEGAGCAADADPIACLRAKTAQEVLAALPPDVTGLTFADFNPIIDGEVLPVSPLSALAAGVHADVPLVLGTNEHETYNMLPPPGQIATEQAFQVAARQFLAGAGVPAGRIDDVLAIYPVSDYASPHAALVALTTDARWSCPGRAVLRTLASTATAPIYRYYFTQGLDPTRAPNAARAGAYHGLELFYVFGTVDGAGNYEATAEDLELSARMQRYWSRFAASGDPNGAADPVWPLYDAATDPFLRLDVPTSTAAGVRSAQCDAIAAL